MTKSEALLEAAVRADIEGVGILVAYDAVGKRDGAYFTVREDAEVGLSMDEVSLFLVKATPIDKEDTA